jgi:uncharacterized membrane protein YcaP (DUF421 family)
MIGSSRKGKPMLATFHHLIGEEPGHIAWWQMSNRAVLVFVYAVLLYRLAPRRSFANLSAFDIILTVIVGSALSRSLTGNAPVLPTLAATAALVVLHTIFSVLAPRSEAFSWLSKGRPIRLISDGTIDWSVARRNLLGPRDIEEQLRLKGLNRLEQVDEAYLERNGQISIVKKA